MAPVLDQSRLTGLICHCRKVPYDDVEAVIGAGRATTLADIQRETTACTRCFGCRFEIERMLHDHLGERYQRSAFVSLPTEERPGGLRRRARALLRGAPATLPKRMYMPIMDGFHGEVRTRV